MSRSCRLRRSILVCALVSSGVVLGATQSSAAVPDFTTELVPVDGELLAIQSTANPDYAIALFGAGNDRFRWTLSTDEMIEMPNGDLTLDADGVHAWEAVWPNTIRRHDVVEKTVVDYTIPFVTDWGVAGVAAASPNRRFLLVSASSGNLAAVRSFLFDTKTGTLLSPDPGGVGALHNSYGIAVSNDGKIVEYSENSFVGDTLKRMRWDRTTGTRTLIDSPASDPALTLSPNRRWAVFVSDDQLHRRNLDAGPSSDVVVPIDPAEVLFYAVRDAGRVIVEHTVETDDLADSRQVSAWDGTGALTLLSIGVDGKPADYGVAHPLTGQAFVANADGSIIAFATFATNLPPTLSAPDERRLYRIDLRRLPNEPSSPVGAQKRYCVPVVGAAPGQFVAVNVTPVLSSTAGFGTMHSSDDAAGSTSNVNFFVGSVDPNVAFVEVGADGEVCYTNSDHGPVHVIIDELVVGASSVFTQPTDTGSDRLIDTRNTTPVAASATRCFGANGEIGDFTAVNVTPVGAGTPGFGVIHSSDEDAGATSNVNFGPNTTDPNVAFTKIGSEGICFTNSDHGPVDVIVDQLVLAPASTFSLPTADGAERLLDTREGGGPIGPSARRCVRTVGTEPGDWVVVNATPVLATTPGFGTIHSSDDEAGATSNVNFGPGTVDPNIAIAQVGSDSKVCFTNSEHGAVHLVLDQLVNADENAFSRATSDGAKRLTDTRIARF